MIPINIVPETGATLRWNFLGFLHAVRAGGCSWWHSLWAPGLLLQLTPGFSMALVYTCYGQGVSWRPEDVWDLPTSTFSQHFAFFHTPQSQGSSSDL